MRGRVIFKSMHLRAPKMLAYRSQQEKRLIITTEARGIKLTNTRSIVCALSVGESVESKSRNSFASDHLRAFIRFVDIVSLKVRAQR